MPFVKGQPRPPSSGRKKGDGQSKSARFIMRELKCDPIAGMIAIATDKDNKPELRGRMFAELAQYEHPKLRAIELSGVGPGGSIPITHDGESEKDSFARRIIDLAERARPEPDPSADDGSGSAGA